jgi:[protein-PII] uridylyltransferase
VRTPSEHSHLDDFLDLRDSLRTARSGRGGFEVCRDLTAALDTAIRSLTSERTDVAVVAIGGYGRGELSLFSDVDLMLLHEVGDPSDEAANLFRPLWDANLRVGHAVRTSKEASAAAKERFDTQTTLLTSRLVSGSQELFDRLMSEVAGVTRARPLRRHLVAEERERRLETPYLLMAPNLKTGRGGLRTLQGFEWERRREDLIGRFSRDSRPEEGDARETLLRVRNALHASAGRAHDVFSPDLREPVARWLGADLFETARDLVGAMQAVDRLASLRWPEVLDERPGPLGRRVWARLIGKPESLSAVSPPSVDELMWILQSDEQGRLVFERLFEKGLVDDLLPEWEVVRSLPQLAPFHEHPVDVHLWRTVHEMRLLMGEPHYGRIAAELDAPEVLLLSAFLHDIGKGHGGDHARVGAGIAASFCARLGLDGRASSLIEGAVAHHLLLARAATRRDLDDPAVVDEITETVGDLAALQVIYLLTVADSRATGTTMWSDWKATLLRTLFVRCAARFGAEHAAPVEAGTTIGIVLEAVGADLAREFESHLIGMPDEYLRSATVDDVVWHFDLIGSVTGASGVGVRSEEPLDKVVVVGHARPRFRRLVAESFAANGIDVLEARLHSRVDGMIVDTFRVRDDRTGGSVPADRWARARVDIEAALAGELDTESKVAERAAAYPTSSPGVAKPSVDGSFDAATGDLVLTIKCADRIGRLAEILDALHRCGLEIRLAKLDSRGEQLVDTFHVRSDSDVDIEHLEALVAGSITP